MTRRIVQGVFYFTIGGALMTALILGSGWLEANL